MQDLTPLVILLAHIFVGAVVAVCVLLATLRRYRLARHFGDLAARSTGQRAERAQQLALEALRERSRGSKRKNTGG